MLKCIAILLTVIPLVTWGQTLTLDELFKLQKSDFVEVNDILTYKGWGFSHSKKGAIENYNTVTWAFEKNSFNEAIGWLTLYTGEDSENILSYQMHSSRIYNSIKSQIVEYKMKSINNSIGDNEISSVYQGQKYTVIISINSSKDKSNPHYVIGVLSNDTYTFIKINQLLENIDQSGSDNNGNDKVNVKYDDNLEVNSATLDLAGWNWDYIPKPNLSAKESGRVIFEIKVDDSGEIISIRTIERSVSLEAEYVCRKEIEKLTFSKTGTNVPAISSGRITFVIRSN